jgi:hypothetical protein
MDSSPAQDPNDPGIYALDTNIYLRVVINNDSLINLGVKTQGEPTNSPLLRGSYFVNIDSFYDGSGNLIQNMTMESRGSLGNIFLQGTLLARNECDFICGGKKPGAATGSYILTSNPLLTDIRNSSGISYQMQNGNPYSLFIRGMDSLYVWGDFSIMMNHSISNQSYNAIGLFKLNRI